MRRDSTIDRAFDDYGLEHRASAQLHVAYLAFFARRLAFIQAG